MGENAVILFDWSFPMKLLEERICRDGRILPGDVLKVDSFLNHQIDVSLISECGAEWKDDDVLGVWH